MQVIVENFNSKVEKYAGSRAQYIGCKVVAYCTDYIICVHYRSH